jgi:hypothetical protein
MANPIMPSGRRRMGALEEAITQDRERRIREDEEYFQRTGINRPPRYEIDPLVDNDRYRDVAADGDTYDDRYTPPLGHRTLEGEYVEDSPSQLIDPDSRRRSIPRAPRNEREAYMQRERETEEKEFQRQVKENLKRFNNGITSLELDQE